MIKNKYRLILFFIVPPIIVCLSLILLTNQYYYSSVLIFLLIPMSRFLMIGSLRQRTRNTLPFLAALLYLMAGLEFGVWDNAQIIFLSIPIISILLKPRRHGFQYMILVLSFGTLFLNVYSNLYIPFWYRIIVIILIYIAFYPPVVYSAFKKLIRS